MSPISRDGQLGYTVLEKVDKEGNLISREELPPEVKIIYDCR